MVWGWDVGAGSSVESGVERLAIDDLGLGMLDGDFGHFRPYVAGVDFEAGIALLDDENSLVREDIVAADVPDFAMDLERAVFRKGPLVAYRQEPLEIEAIVRSMGVDLAERRSSEAFVVLDDVAFDEGVGLGDRVDLTQTELACEATLQR